jgi:hypothetical protein
MAGARMFQAVQTPGALHARPSNYSRLFDEASALSAARDAENKADGVNATPVKVVASIDQNLLGNLIDTENIDADSVYDCTDESVMEFLESTQEHDASITAEFIKAEVLAKVTLLCLRRIRLCAF